MQDAGTVDEAVNKIDATGITQPLLFLLRDKYWIKADHTALPVLDAACFSDCVETLVKFFFRFSCGLST